MPCVCPSTPSSPHLGSDPWWLFHTFILFYTEEQVVNHVNAVDVALWARLCWVLATRDRCRVRDHAANGGPEAMRAAAMS